MRTRRSRRGCAAGCARGRSCPTTGSRPEHPFPAAPDDCHAAYRGLLAQGIAPQNIVLAGDSAGGNLALVTLLPGPRGGRAAAGVRGAALAGRRLHDGQPEHVRATTAATR